MLRRCSIIFVFAILGCAAKPKDEFVAADQVPATVTAVGDELHPGFKYDQVWKFEQDGETVYELRGKTPDGKSPDGKSHEATVSEGGKVIWPIRKQ